MFSRYDIKPRTQSEDIDPEDELLGTGNFAQYINVAVATKIYREEMDRIRREGGSLDDSDDTSDDGDESKMGEVRSVEDHIEQSTLIGGYQKSKKLRARNIRKQRIREQKEQYERYRKRVEYEKKKKRYEQRKEKKEQKRLRKEAKRQKREAQRMRDGHKGSSGWMEVIESVQSTVSSVLGMFDSGQQNERREEPNVNGSNSSENEEESDSKLDDYIELMMAQQLSKQKSKKNEEERRLKEMVKRDCIEMGVIDLNEYYTRKIMSSAEFSRMVMDFNSFRKMVTSMAIEDEECRGVVDTASGTYCRWNERCETLFALWKKNNDGCSEQQCRAQKLKISRSVFARNKSPSDPC